MFRSYGGPTHRNVTSPRDRKMTSHHSSHITAHFLRRVVSTRIPYYSYQYLVENVKGRNFAKRLWYGSDDNIKMDTK